ncbi:SDR family oxidoreductase [Spirosoma validum]|uniref:NAD(P)H-binding protein n=1 Tax=Spirosoma validum TaxID=2771355 RepID=A0A927GDE7_9BACT|nr:NAD(P)H-binding protein [Spirosoma validum]MBD2753639.1 NAD(P)H-binding protein [Spirosoma validum]
MNIAIIGANGLIGKPVTQQLIDAGFSVTILARHPEQVRSLFPTARIIQADLQNPASIRAGLQNQQALYLNLSVRQDEKPGDFHTETDGMKTIIAAAKQAGIQRIGYLSSLVMRYQGMNGFHWWVFDIKHEAVRLLKASDIPVTIFYPSTFMESFLMQIQGPFLALGGSSTIPLWFIAGSDYGRQVVRAFQQSDDQNRDYVIQGPEAYTYEEAARQFVQHYPQKKLLLMKAPVEVLQFLGRFNQKMNYGGHILEALNKYPERFEAEQTWADLGKPTITINDYARQV